MRITKFTGQTFSCLDFKCKQILKTTCQCSNRNHQPFHRSLPQSLPLDGGWAFLSELYGREKSNHIDFHFKCACFCWWLCFSLARGLKQHPLGEMGPSLSKEWVGPRNKTLGIHGTEGRGPQSHGNHGALGETWPMKILP